MYYETIFIVNPDISQENTESITDNFVERVEKAGGRIVKREYWGSRPLAYSIAKRKRGHYVMLVTDGEPQAVETLEQAIRLDERIMRFLTTRLTELSDEPSPLIRRRATPAAQEEKTDDKPASEEAKAETTETAAEAPAAEEVKAESAETAAKATEAPAAKKAKAKSAETAAEATEAPAAKKVKAKSAETAAEATEAPAAKKVKAKSAETSGEEASS